MTPAARTRPTSDVRRIIADLDARVRSLLHELTPDLELRPSVVSDG